MFLTKIINKKYMNYHNFGRLLLLILVSIIGFNLLFKYKKTNIEQFEDATGENYEVYRNIIATFNSILARNPNTSEIFKYYKQMNGAEIDSNKLKTILQNSDEYKRTEAIQNNLTSNKIVDSINEQQVNSEIIALYTEIFNKSPTDIDVTYFRQKYLELDLDKDDLKKYMLATPDYIKYASIIKEAEADLKASSTNELKPINKAAFPDVDKKDSVTVSDGKATYIIERPNIFNFYTADGEGEQDLIDRSSKLIHSNMVDKPDNITETNITEIQGEDICKTDKETTSCTLLKKKSMSNHIQNRNLDELKYKCKNNSKYSNADTFGKLIPTMEWQVPQERAPICYGSSYSANPLNSQTALIGTLLGDSKDTQIGSIMPKFKYTEETSNSSCGKK